MRKSRRLMEKNVNDEAEIKDEVPVEAVESQSEASSDSDASSSSDSESDNEEDAADMFAALDIGKITRKTSRKSPMTVAEVGDQAIREASRLLQMPLLPRLPGARSSVAGAKVDGYLRQGQDVSSSSSVARAASRSAALHNGAYGEASASHAPGTGRQGSSTSSSSSGSGRATAPSFHSRNPHGQDHGKAEDLDDPRTSERARAAAIANRESIRAKSRKHSDTAGRLWFDMPKAEPTAEARREVAVLRNRGYMDPKRHFKTTAEQRKMGMVYYQLGTVVEGVGEGKNMRIKRKDRKKTMLDEVAADDRIQRFADKYYKKEMARGQRARKGGKVRLKKRAREEAGGGGGDAAGGGGGRRDRTYRPIKRLRS